LASGNSAIGNGNRQWEIGNRQSQRETGMMLLFRKPHPDLWAIPFQAFDPN